MAGTSQDLQLRENNQVENIQQQQQDQDNQDSNVSNEVLAKYLPSDLLSDNANNLNQRKRDLILESKK